MNHCRGESELLLHSVGVISDQGFGTIGELHEFKQFLRAALGCSLVEAIHLADELQILCACQALEKAHAFWNNANLALHVNGVRCKVHAEKLHTAGGWRKQTSQNLDGRRFPGAVWSEKTEELSRRYLKIDAVDGGEVPKPACQFLRLNSNIRHRDSPWAVSGVECKTLT